MKTLYAAALGAALILPGVAMAQSSTPSPGATTEPPASSSGSMTSPGTGSDPSASPSTSGGTLSTPDTSASGSLSTSGQTAAAGMAGEGHEVIGKKLQNAQGDELGEISNVLINSQGQVAKLVLDAEGGEKVELDWQRVTMTQEGDIEATMQKEEVAELPKYEEKSN